MRGLFAKQRVQTFDSTRVLVAGARLASAFFRRRASRTAALAHARHRLVRPSEDRGFWENEMRGLVTPQRVQTFESALGSATVSVDFAWGSVTVTGLVTGAAFFRWYLS